MSWLAIDTFEIHFHWGERHRILRFCQNVKRVRSTCWISCRNPPPECRPEYPGCRAPWAKFLLLSCTRPPGKKRYSSSFENWNLLKFSLPSCLSFQVLRPTFWLDSNCMVSNQEKVSDLSWNLLKDSSGKTQPSSWSFELVLEICRVQASTGEVGVQIWGIMWKLTSNQSSTHGQTGRCPWQPGPPCCAALPCQSQAGPSPSCQRRPRQPFWRRNNGEERGK